MRFKSQVLTQASGSVGGITYTRSRGGMVQRARATPIQPDSAYQQAVRSYMGTLSAAWSALTDAQRAAWETYAASVLMADALGDMINIGGRQHFIRSNIPRLQSGLSVVSAGPTTLSLPALSVPGGAITAATSVHAVTFTNTDVWAGAVGGALLLFYSRPVPPTVNSFSGPYRYGGKVAGAGTPPTSPGSITIPFVGTAGNKIFWRAEAVTADGRMSSPFRAGSVLA